MSFYLSRSSEAITSTSSNCMDIAEKNPFKRLPQYTEHANTCFIEQNKYKGFRTSG